MSEENLFYLIEKFEKNPRPNKAEVQKLADETKLTTERIVKWYGKRRFDTKIK